MGARRNALPRGPVGLCCASAASRRARARSEPGDPALQTQAFNKLLRAAMHMPAVEALFPAPWTAAARRVLPSPSPQLTATEMWGPVLAWCVLQWLAESMNALPQPERTALDLFDRLRLREPFGHAFTALGFQGEEAWRVAARIKVLLLTGAGAGDGQRRFCSAGLQSGCTGSVHAAGRQPRLHACRSRRREDRTPSCAT